VTAGRLVLQFSPRPPHSRKRTSLFVLGGRSLVTDPLDPWPVPGRGQVTRCRHARPATGLTAYDGWRKQHGGNTHPVAMFNTRRSQIIHHLH